MNSDDVFTYADEYNTYVHEGKTYHEVDAKMRWALGSFDGVMSGIAEHNGKLYYAKCHQCYETRAPRYFWLYPLTPEEAAAETKLHQWVQKYIGLCEYDEEGLRKRRDPLTWREWYWEFMRIVWNKSFEDRVAVEKSLGLSRYRTYNNTREAVGFFTFERIRENKLDKEIGWMSKIELKYHSNYWDGPLSGVCILQGKRRWFNNVHDYHSKTEEGKNLDMRIYAIYDLTPEEWKEEDHWHLLFEKYVGTHTSYDDCGNRTGKVHSSKDHHRFYEESKKAWKDGFRKKKVLNEDNLIGYFDRSEMKYRKTKYRDYWLEGESPYSTHSMDSGICSNHELVEWRTDAQNWDHFDSDFDGKTPGWAVCMQPNGTDYKGNHWMIVKFCPWCGERLLA